MKKFPSRTFVQFFFQNIPLIKILHVILCLIQINNQCFTIQPLIVPPANRSSLGLAEIQKKQRRDQGGDNHFLAGFDYFFVYGYFHNCFIGIRFLIFPRPL
jgi:hypothetical protein